MLTFNDTQTAILQSSYKVVRWLTEITLAGSATPDYFWSQESYTFGGQLYTFKVLSIGQMSLVKGNPESGILPSSRVTITITNKDNTLSSSDFEGASVTNKLVMQSGVYAATQILSFTFKVISASSVNQVMALECEDFLSSYLRGDYPKKRLVSDLFPCPAMDQDNVCVPLAFGEPFIPLRWLAKNTDATYVDVDTFTVTGDQTALFAAGQFLIASCGNDGAKSCFVDSSSFGGAVTTVNLTAASDDLTVNLTSVQTDYYCLGEAGPDYTVSEARSPAQCPRSVYSDDDYDFKVDSVTGSDGGSYGAVQLLASVSGTGGTNNSNAFFPNGSSRYDVPFRFSRSDLVDKTNLADIVDYVIKDMGIPAAMVDATSQAAAAAVYTANGLICNVGLYCQQGREKLLCKLMALGGMVPLIRDKVYYKILTKTSQATFTKDDILPGSFSIQKKVYRQDEKDSAYVSWAESGEPQDQPNKSLVSLKSGVDSPSTDVIEAEWIEGSAEALKAGILALQKKLLPVKEISFNAFFYSLGLEPGDMITIDDPNLDGSSYDAMIEKIVYDQKGIINFTCTVFSDALDDWADLTESDIVTYAALDDARGYSPIYQGANDATGNGINTITASVLIGANGVLATNARPEINGGFRATNTELVCYNASGAERFKADYSGGATDGNVTMGNYAGGQGAQWDQSAGLFDVAGGISATSGTIAGWTIDADEIKKITSNAGISLNSVTPALVVTDANSYQRVFLGKSGATYGLTVRDESNNIIININDTNKNISGWTVDNEKLYNTNSYISSASFISFGTTPPLIYGNNPGVWLGWTAGATAKAQLSLYTDANHYLQFDGNKPIIKSDYFSLASDGKLTVTEASIRRSLNADDITAGMLTSRTIQTAGSKLTQATSGGATTVYLNDTALFPASGIAWVYDTSVDEFTYTGKTSTSLTGCSGVLAHSVGLAIGGQFKRMIVSALDNEMHFVGDRGDGVYEELASIGIKTEGSDSFIGYFGSANSGNGKIGLTGKSYLSFGLYGWSHNSSAVLGHSVLTEGICGISDNGDGVYGYSDIGNGIDGESGTGYGGRFFTDDEYGKAPLLGLNPTFVTPSAIRIKAV